MSTFFFFSFSSVPYTKPGSLDTLLIQTPKSFPHSQKCLLCLLEVKVTEIVFIYLDSRNIWSNTLQGKDYRLQLLTKVFGLRTGGCAWGMMKNLLIFNQCLTMYSQGVQCFATCQKKWVTPYDLELRVCWMCPSADTLFLHNYWKSWKKLLNVDFMPGLWREWSKCFYSLPWTLPFIHTMKTSYVWQANLKQNLTLRVVSSLPAYNRLLFDWAGTKAPL